MSISRDQVAHIARLARLDLTPEEMDGLTHDLAEILAYVEKISGLESSRSAGSEPPPASATPFRADLVTPSLPVAFALAPSADHDESFFRVPPVIEREEG